MQAHQRGFAGRLGVAVCHASDGCFLQGQDIAEIVREILEERLFGGTGVTEDRSEAQPPCDFEKGFANCGGLAQLGLLLIGGQRLKRRARHTGGGWCHENSPFQKWG